MAFIAPLSHTLSTARAAKRVTPRRATKRPPRCSARAQGPQPSQERDEGEVPLELVDGYLDNAKVRPKIDIDADEYMLMWKLRKMLNEEDFNKIFDSNSRQIGEL